MFANLRCERSYKLALKSLTIVFARPLWQREATCILLVLVQNQETEASL